MTGNVTLQLALLRPCDKTTEGLQQFLNGKLSNLRVGQKDYASTAIFSAFPNPSGRPAPDDKTFAVFHQTRENSSAQNWIKLEPSEGVDAETRWYDVLEAFDPKHLGSREKKPQFLVHAEIRVEDADKLREFYRVDHTIAMSKIPGYLRTTLYSYRHGGKGKADPLLIIHEFDTLEHYIGPELKEAAQTLVSLFPLVVDSMITRTWRLSSDEV